MKFGTNRKHLLDILTKVNQIAAGTTYDIHSCVKIEVVEGTITFTTSNGSTQITECLYPLNDCEETNASIYVYCKQLYNIAKNAKADDIFTFQITDDNPKQLIVETHRTSYTLVDFDTTSYHNRNEQDQLFSAVRPWDVDSKHMFSMPIGSYLDAIDKVSFACARDKEFRDFLKGVCFETTGEVVSFTATDSRKLANVVIEEGNADANDNIEAIIGKKELLLIKKCLTHDKSLDPNKDCIDVFVEYRGYEVSETSSESRYHKVYIVHGNGCIVVKNINSRFPEWEKFLEETNRNNSVVFNVDSLRQSVSDVIALAMNKDNYPVLGMSTSGDKGYIKSIFYDENTAVSQFDVSDELCSSQKELFVCFNYEVLKETLDKIDTNYGIIYYHNNCESVVLKNYRGNGISTNPQSQPDSDLDYQYILMPVQPDRYQENMDLRYD